MFRFQKKTEPKKPEESKSQSHENSTQTDKCEDKEDKKEKTEITNTATSPLKTIINSQETQTSPPPKIDNHPSVLKNHSSVIFTQSSTNKYSAYTKNFPLFSTKLKRSVSPIATNLTPTPPPFPAEESTIKFNVYDKKTAKTAISFPINENTSERSLSIQLNSKIKSLKNMEKSNYYSLSIEADDNDNFIEENIKNLDLRSIIELVKKNEKKVINISMKPCNEKPANNTYYFPIINGGFYRNSFFK